MSEDYYSILGVSKSASQEEIEKAHRALARKYHPDMNPDDPDAKKKFQKMQEAFEVIGNPEKRKMYDQYGSGFADAGANPWAAGGPQGAGFHWSGGAGRQGGAFNIEDILGMFGAGGATAGGFQHFGGGGAAGSGFQDFFNMGMDPNQSGAGARGSSSRRRPRPSGSQDPRNANHQQDQTLKGADTHHTIAISFAKSIQGGKESILLKRPRQKKPETVSFTIPPGVEDGKKIRLRGLGNPGEGGAPAGDVIVTIRVEPHSLFKRQGRNLLLKVPVSLQEAVFGAKVDVPSPKGWVSVTVPPGSSSGVKLRVKGCGVPTPPISGKGAATHSSEAGDLIVELTIALPRDWTEADKELLAQLTTKPPFPVRQNLHWER